jgi:Subtilase family
MNCSHLHVGYNLMDPTYEAAERLEVFKRWMQRAEDNDVVVVMSAGNEAFKDLTLGTIVPQNLGTPTNGIITVGGVYKDGSLWPWTVPETPSDKTTRDYPLTGSMTCYALADNVMSYDSTKSTSTTTGTSFAAPVVVSLPPRYQRAVLIRAS